MREPRLDTSLADMLSDIGLEMDAAMQDFTSSAFLTGFRNWAGDPSTRIDPDACLRATGLPIRPGGWVLPST